MPSPEWLHGVLAKKAWQLFRDEHYSQAGFEAMVEVEKALRAKTLAPPGLSGQKLTARAWGKRSSLCLEVRNSLGDLNPVHLGDFFRSTLCLYRNPLAHEMPALDAGTAYRLLVLASELLYLERLTK